MKKATILLFATAIAAFANDLFEGQGDAPDDNPETGEAPKRKGRPPGSANKAPAEVIEQATPQPAPAPAPAATVNPLGSKTFEEMRALIGPLVDAGKGADIKAIALRYSPEGLKGLPLDKQAAFWRDVQALDI